MNFSYIRIRDNVEGFGVFPANFGNIRICSDDIDNFWIVSVNLGNVRIPDNADGFRVSSANFGNIRTCSDNIDDFSIFSSNFGSIQNNIGQRVLLIIQILTIFAYFP